MVGIKCFKYLRLLFTSALIVVFITFTTVSILKYATGVKSFTDNITDDLPENISPPTFSFCPFDPVQHTAWENLYNSDTYEKVARKIEDLVVNITDLEEHYYVERLNTMSGKCLALTSKMKISQEKSAKNKFHPILFKTKVNARLHMPGEEISIVYNVEDQDSIDIVEFDVTNHLWCTATYAEWDDSATTTCKAWETDKAFFDCVKSSLRRTLLDNNSSCNVHFEKYVMKQNDSFRECDTPEEGIKRNKLFDQAILQMFDNDDGKCLPRCISRGWRLKCSLSRYPYNDSSITSLYGRLEVNSRKKTIEYYLMTELNLIGEVGGMLGLLLGWSILGSCLDLVSCIFMKTIK
ncbi:uncharacterized protein LOC111701967 [Eurytemora carolleeae]|uniref:uncharacterized protein LOC111701967 n=1 Tax=Eurytemora carolleeae TaxID=1294199 RepID=UPI000C794C97|nr:uncharacterized protein LOC111701967 [Eurytemora carolleeae]|eukprot:XP_023329241.1 uncharacterized protein LOC111701967 [Eurytemora affinis]